MADFVRLTIGRAEENERLLSTLRELLGSGEIASVR
jgi:histidinol-phosphate/aromatic aminotransferase/cobyric acid decarboxylase-like protein